MKTIISYLNGNRIYLDGNDDLWRYYEDDKLTDQPKPCPKCNCLPTKEGHDMCLGKLPGVKSACCGHGIKEAYVAFDNGITIRGKLEKSEE